MKLFFHDTISKHEKQYLKTQEKLKSGGNIVAKIEDIDKNFKNQTVKEEGLTYYNCLSEPFSLHGFSSPRESGVFSRLPLSFAECGDVSGGVRRLMFNTSGGRVRFRTNSKTVAIKAEVVEPAPMNHMPVTGSRGFDLYAKEADAEDLTFRKSMVSSELTYNISHEFDDKKLRDVTINFPLYNGVKSLFIGLEENCTLTEPLPYAIEKPIVFYGSSVSQGACASRPGANYIPTLSRWLDADFINLGFSGNDKGEEALAHHIASLDMSAFVYGYGYNIPTVEHYENTHYPFYEIVRKKNPELPIIIMSSPMCPKLKNKNQLSFFAKAREVAINSFEKAKKNGDNVYFIDGFTLLENPDATVDCTHPTDLGFYEMAKKIYPILKKILTY